MSFGHPNPKEKTEVFSIQILVGLDNSDSRSVFNTLVQDANSIIIRVFSGMEAMNLLNYTRQLTRAALATFAVGISVFALTGCGGGGGGGGTPPPPNPTGTSIRGKVLLVSGSPVGTTTATAATVSTGRANTTASTTDGSFTLSNIDPAATTLTIAAREGATNLGRTVAVTLTANQVNDLGVIYVSPDGYNASVTGQVTTVTSTGTVGVGNAKVTIAGSSTTTNASGQFSLSGLPVGVGNVPGSLVGSVEASGFETLQVTAETIRFPLIAGNNALSAFLIQRPSGSVPLPPYTIIGKVTSSGVALSGATVRLTNIGNNIGTTTTDANGNYTFWVVPADYTITASKLGSTDASASVTLSRVDVPVTVPTINLVSGGL